MTGSGAGLELVCTLPFGCMAHYPADIELLGLVHKDLGHFLSGKERPSSDYTLRDIYGPPHAQDSPGRDFLAGCCFPAFLRAMIASLVAFNSFSASSAASASWEACQSLKIQPAVLGVRLYELFRLLTVQLPFKMGYTLLQTVDFFLLPLGDYGILVRQ